MRDRLFNWAEPCLGSVGNSASVALRLRPIAGYAPHPDRSYWLLVFGIAAVLCLALTLP
jgi:hypothetical protein